MSKCAFESKCPFFSAVNEVYKPAPEQTIWYVPYVDFPAHLCTASGLPLCNFICKGDKIVVYFKKPRGAWCVENEGVVLKVIETSGEAHLLFRSATRGEETLCLLRHSDTDWSRAVCKVKVATPAEPPKVTLSAEVLTDAAQLLDDCLMRIYPEEFAPDRNEAMRQRFFDAGGTISRISDMADKLRAIAKG